MVGAYLRRLAAAACVLTTVAVFGGGSAALAPGVALARDGGKVDKLIDALGNEDGKVVRRSMRQLVKIGPSAAPAVRRAFAAEHEKKARSRTRVRRLRALVEVLGALADAPSRPGIEGLYGESDDPLVRNVCLQALGYIGKLDSLEMLADAAVKDESPVVRARAIEAITRLSLAFKNLEGAEREAAAKRYVDVGLPPIREALTDPAKQVRYDAVRALGHLRDKESVDLVGKALLRDKDPMVRQFAAESLGAIGGSLFAMRARLNQAKEPVPAWVDLRITSIVDWLIQALPDEEEKVASNTCLALGALEDRRAVPGLIILLGHEDDDLRLVSSHALAAIKDRRAIPALVKNLDSGNDNVRKAATQALRQITDELPGAGTANEWKAWWAAGHGR